MICLLLIISILLIPEPVSFTPEEGVCRTEKVVVRQDRRAFRKAVRLLHVVISFVFPVLLEQLFVHVITP